MSYCPDRGDIVYVDFQPQAGREQSKRRPGLVLTDASYNLKSSLFVICPVTGVRKGYPFEVLLPDSLSVSGVVLADHVKSLDWRARRAEHVCVVPDDVVDAVLDRIADLLRM